MNYDLITKLAKLANNNPNENEANLAARKVCRLLAEGEFKFTNQQPQPQPQQNSYNPYQKSYQRPPNEPPPAYQRPRSRYGDWSYFYDDNYRDDDWWYKREPKEYDIPKDKWPDFKTASKQTEERDLKCKTCKKVVKTKFVGLAEIFECNTCQWTAYEKEHKKQKSK